MYSYFYPSKSFISFIKTLENAQRSGFDEKLKLWFPHDSPEGGLPTIAYGHKVHRNELCELSRGISDVRATEILLLDIESAYSAVVNYVTTRIGEYDLSEKQSEMLVEFAFNLGTLRGFPKFVKSVVGENWGVSKKECIRYYTDSSGKRHELSRRNELFINRFFIQVK